MVVFMFFAAHRSSAALLVYEGFDYSPDTTPSEWNGGSGLAESWNVEKNPGEHEVMIKTGLSFGRLQVSGNSLGMESAADVKGTPRYSKLKRSLNIEEQSSGTIWVSYLVSRTSGHSSGANAIRLMNGGSKVRDFTAEYKTFNTAGGVPGLHLNGKTSNGAIPTPNQDGGILLVIASYKLGQPAAAQLWIFDVAGFEKVYEKIEDGALKDRDLKAACNQQVSLVGADPVVVNNQDVIEFFQQTKFPSGDDGGLKADYDELRIGTSLLSVIPLGAPVPVEADSGSQRRILFKSGE